MECCVVQPVSPMLDDPKQMEEPQNYPAIKRFTATLGANSPCVLSYAKRQPDKHAEEAQVEISIDDDTSEIWLVAHCNLCDGKRAQGGEEPERRVGRLLNFYPGKEEAEQKEGSQGSALWFIVDELRTRRLREVLENELQRKALQPVRGSSAKQRWPRWETQGLCTSKDCELQTIEVHKTDFWWNCACLGRTWKSLGGSRVTRTGGMHDGYGCIDVLDGLRKADKKWAPFVKVREDVASEWAEPFTISEDFSIMLLQESLGAGKTTQERNLVEAALTRQKPGAWPPEMYELLLRWLRKWEKDLGPGVKPTFLILASRRTFCESQAHAFRDYKFSFKPLDALGSDRGIWTFESLHLLGEIRGQRPGGVAYNILLLDECESLLYQATQGLNTEKDLLNMLTLEMLVREADKIICLDAFMTPRTLEVLHAMRRGTGVAGAPAEEARDCSTYLRCSSFRKQNNRLYYEHKNRQSIERKILLDLLSGKKVIVAGGNRRDLIKMCDNIAKLVRNLKIRCYFGARSKEFLRRDLGEGYASDFKNDLWPIWSKLNLVCFSCTLTFGVSFAEPPGVSEFHFHAMYVLLDNNEILARDYAQMSGRARNVHEMHVYFKTPFVSTNAPLTLKHVEASLVHTVNAERAKPGSGLVFQHGFRVGMDRMGRLAPVRNWNFISVAYGTLEKNLSMYRAKDTFCYYLWRMGCDELVRVDYAATELPPPEEWHQWPGEVTEAMHEERNEEADQARKERKEAKQSAVEQLEEAATRMSDEELQNEIKLQEARVEGEQPAQGLVTGATPLRDGTSGRSALERVAYLKLLLRHPSARRELTYATACRLAAQKRLLGLLGTWCLYSGRPETFLAWAEGQLAGLSDVPVLSVQRSKNLTTRVMFLEALAKLLLGEPQLRAGEAGPLQRPVDRLLGDAEISWGTVVTNQRKLESLFKDGHALWTRSHGLLISRNTVNRLSCEAEVTDDGRSVVKKTALSHHGCRSLLQQFFKTCLRSSFERLENADGKRLRRESTQTKSKHSIYRVVLLKELKLSSPVAETEEEGGSEPPVSETPAIDPLRLIYEVAEDPTLLTDSGWSADATESKDPAQKKQGGEGAGGSLPPGGKKRKKSAGGLSLGNSLAPGPKKQRR